MSPTAPPTVDRERLIADHLQFVGQIAKESLGALSCSHAARAQYEELRAAGMLGLVQAAARYKPSFGVTFAAFAARRIRGAIADHLRMEDGLSRTVCEKATAWTRATAQLTMSLQRRPTRQEVASHLGLNTEAEITQYAEAVAMRHPKSIDDDLALDTPISTRYAPLSRAVTLVDSAPTPADLALQAEDKAQLRIATSSLPPASQILIDLRYYKGLTFRAIGKVLGVSEWKVRKDERRALAQLREILAPAR